MSEYGLPEEAISFGQQPKVVETSAIQETTEPVANLVEKANWLLYKRGAVTRRSVARSEDNPQGIERPLFARARRAQLLKEIQDAPDNVEKKRLIEKAHAIDNIVQQYLSQSELTVTLPEYGTQTAKAYT